MKLPVSDHPISEIMKSGQAVLWLPDLKAA